MYRLDNISEEDMPFSAWYDSWNANDNQETAEQLVSMGYLKEVEGK